MPEFLGFRWGDGGNGEAAGLLTWSLVGAGVGGLNFAGGKNAPSVSPTSVGGKSVEETLRKAFDTWARTADVEFVQVADTGEDVKIGDQPADIRIVFGALPALRLPGETVTPLGVASTDFVGERIEDSTIVLNAELTRSEVQSVALHEIGHSLGLDHVDDPNTVMSVRDNGRLTLAADDRDGITTLYGKQNSSKAVFQADADKADINVVDGKSVTLLGDAAANALLGGSARDTIKGGDGDDVLMGRAGNDRIIGGSGDDRLGGASGDDRLKGGGGDDKAGGGGGDDRLRGMDGDDLLKGGGGDDTLTGGAGADRMKGGGGADLFVFRPGDGANVVQDFDIARDMLSVEVAGFAALTIADGPDGAVVSAEGVSITLNGVAAASLSPDDFGF